MKSKQANLGIDLYPASCMLIEISLEKTLQDIYDTSHNT